MDTTALFRWWDHKEKSGSDYRFVYLGKLEIASLYNVVIYTNCTQVQLEAGRRFIMMYFARIGTMCTRSIAGDSFVVTSFDGSWSVNICGRKEWIFYPPDDVCVVGLL